MIAPTPSAIANPAPRQLRTLGPLLLLTFGIHLAEEFWGGIGFSAWVRLHSGIPLTEAIALRLNGTFLLVMAVLVTAGWFSRSARWVFVPLGMAELTNGVLHLITSVLTLSYSPGLISGVLLWIPLGVLILRTANRIWPTSRVVAGALLGVVLHLLVIATAYGATRGR